MNDTEAIIAAVELNLVALGKKFQENDNNYFFTEKELHSYFYHLCISDPAFHHERHSLLHTEFPSPFKFSYTKDGVKREPATSKKTRGHIDCVVVNPHFIGWLASKKLGMEYLYGIQTKNDKFSNYIAGFYDVYREFNKVFGEGILLYALEFKFLRHSYEGTKYPSIGVQQDISKLSAIKSFPVGSAPEIMFVNKTKLVIFIGERSPVGDNIRRALHPSKDGEHFHLFEKKAQV